MTLKLEAVEIELDYEDTDDTRGIILKVNDMVTITTVVNCDLEREDMPILQAVFAAYPELIKAAIKQRNDEVDPIESHCDCTCGHADDHKHGERAAQPADA